MADSHAHDEHGDDYLVHSHITSIKTYVLVFGSLLFFTGLTVAAYNVRLGDYNLFVAVLIAMIKSSIVGAYFMHLKYEKKFNILFFVGSLIFVGVFLAYTLNDTDNRGEESVQGLRIDPGTGNYAYGTALPLETQGEFQPFPPNMVPSEEEEAEADEVEVVDEPADAETEPPAPDVEPSTPGVDAEDLEPADVPEEPPGDESLTGETAPAPDTAPAEGEAAPEGD